MIATGAEDATVLSRDREQPVKAERKQIPIVAKVFKPALVLWIVDPMIAPSMEFSYLVKRRRLHVLSAAAKRANLALFSGDELRRWPGANRNRLAGSDRTNVLEDLFVFGMSRRINEFAFPGTAAARQLGPQPQHDGPISLHLRRSDRGRLTLRFGAESGDAKAQDNSGNDQRLELFHRARDE